MRILLATSNPHKLTEIRAVFDSLRTPDSPAIQLLTLDALDKKIPEPHEDQPTFEGNAIKKARHYATAAQMLCLADDSGLEVDALNGEPGVYSARYAGVNGRREVADPANNRLLLEKVRGVPVEKRVARFVCAMALCAPAEIDPGWLNWFTPTVRAQVIQPDPLGRVLALVRGTVEGRIITPDQAHDPAHAYRGRGGNGFGYDPLFFIPALGKTTAELAPEHKNAISHRGNAARLIWVEFARLFGGPRVAATTDR